MNTRDKLNEVLEGADIRRQQYAAIADGENPSDVVDELYQVGHRQGEAELIAESYLVAIKEVRENVVTNQEALMAMMIMEVSIEATQGKGQLRDGLILDWLCDGEGAYQARDSALLIAPLCCKSSDWAYEQGFDLSEDWEWLPLFLPYLVTQVDAPKDVTQEHCDEAARLALAEDDTGSKA